jgi:hypothetical protein
MFGLVWLLLLVFAIARWQMKKDDEWRNSKGLILAAALLCLVAVPGARAEETHAASLAEQKTCDEQAHKKYHEITDNALFTGSYVGSHYDSKEGACYFRYEMSRILHEDKELEFGSLVRDAFSGKVLAIFLSGDRHPQDYICAVGSTQCKDSTEFNTLVEQRFGL